MNNQLSQIVNEKSSPNRIFEKLGRQSHEILRQVAACIARQIVEFSTHRPILLDILRQFESYPARTQTIDLLLCKRRLTNHANIRHALRRESDWRYWQTRADQACLFAFSNLLEIVKGGKDVRDHYNRFIEQASYAYGFNESKRQMKRLETQQYEFKDGVESKVLETKKHNALRANRGKISAQGVAKVEFLKALKEGLGR